MCKALHAQLEKFKRADFGRCPRVLCYQQPLLPLGPSDFPFQSPVRLYCPRCEDLYRPKSSRHGAIDGAFFGSSFPHMLLMVYPHMIPTKVTVVPPPIPFAQKQYGGVPADVLHQRAVALERRTGNATSAGEETDTSVMANDASSEMRAPTDVVFERVVPRIFGYPVHETSQLMAWQDRQQKKQAALIADFRQQKSASAPSSSKDQQA